MSKKKNLKKLGLEEKITECQNYTQLWAQFFQFWGDRFEGRKITPENEGKFFSIMTSLAEKEFRFSYFMGDDFKKGEDVLDILSEAVSLNNVAEMSDAQFGKFQQEWHALFIAMNKCLGRLMQRRPQKKDKKKAT